jgi:DNA-binding CsgD family transcriptional regulator
MAQEEDIRELLLALTPSARDALRRIPIHDHPIRPETSGRSPVSSGNGMGRCPSRSSSSRASGTPRGISKEQVVDRPGVLDRSSKRFRDHIIGDVPTATGEGKHGSPHARPLLAEHPGEVVNGLVRDAGVVFARFVDGETSPRNHGRGQPARSPVGSQGLHWASLGVLCSDLDPRPDQQPVRVSADVGEGIAFEAMDGQVPPRPDLSPEKNDVLRLIADGISAGELAEELKISERTAHLLIMNFYPRLSRRPDADRPAGTHD